MATVLGHLCQKISPLALGAVYRAREQIGMLAKKLLKLHLSNPEQAEPIVKQLTRELLSHDYLIGRREAKAIGLPVVDATEKEADLTWQVYEDVSGELKLSEPWNWENELGGAQSATRTNVRGVLESRGLKHIFSSTFKIKRVTVTQGPGGGHKVEKLNMTVVEESWKKP